MEALLPGKDKEGNKNWNGKEGRAFQYFDLEAIFSVYPVL